jgi:hypothetical protein
VGARQRIGARLLMCVKEGGIGPPPALLAREPRRALFHE